MITIATLRFATGMVMGLGMGLMVSLADAEGPAASERPRMYFADTASGKPFAKDPAVVKFTGKYWLYYSLSPYQRKATPGWSIVGGHQFQPGRLEEDG